MHKKNSCIAQIAIEYQRVIDDIRYMLTFLNKSDIFALISAFFMILALFCPWFSAPEHLTEIGLMGGGDLHFFLALFVIYQVNQALRVKTRVLDDKNYQAIVAQTLRRISFLYIASGAVSSLAALYFLVYFGMQYENISSMVDVGFGFYLTLLAGFGIMLSGLERFKGSKEPRVKENILGENNL